jgi:hypothetical protein
LSSRLLAILAVAALGAPLAITPARAGSMSFQLETLPDGRGCRAHCPQVIAAEGEISDSTPQEFLDFLRANVSGGDLRVIVFLNSQGGYVVAAMELGQIFRRIGAATVVARIAPQNGRARFLTASCLSACVYAFMGGRKRVVPPRSAIGIHRMFANQVRTDSSGDEIVQKRYDDGSMAVMLMKYSMRMGVSRDLIRSAEHISSDSIHLISSAEMSRWNLAQRVF